MLLPQQRKQAIVLFGLLLIGMALETLGVGLVIPALLLITKNDLPNAYPALVPWLSKLGDPGHDQLVVIGMLGLVGIYAIKAIFLAFMAWQQGHFVARLQASLSLRLFAGYLHQPYAFHLQRNSVQLIRGAINHVNETTMVIQQGLMFISELLVLVGISILLMMVEPVGASLVVSILGLAGWVFYRVTRNRVSHWGDRREYHESLRTLHLHQGLGGVKDVKLLGREDEFLAQYESHSDSCAKLSQRQATMMALPRLWMELLAVVGLAVLILVMLGQGKPLDSIVPTLGLFAAGAFRLMPSLNRILTVVHAVRSVLPGVDALHHEFSQLTGQQKKGGCREIVFESVLALDQVSFCYQGAERDSLQDVSLEISKGQSIGFIGGSGAGKSTLVDVILGLLTPGAGVVSVDGVDIQTDLRSWQDLIGYVPQTIYLTDDTLRRNIAFGIPNEGIDESMVWQALRAAQLECFVKGLPLGLDTVVGERGVRLSGGQRQRIGIARALYHDPMVLVLDEATSSLDVATERGVMEAVSALHGQKTLIIVAHRLSTVSDCDWIYRLEQGLLVDQGLAADMLDAVV